MVTSGSEVRWPRCSRRRRSIAAAQDPDTRRTWSASTRPRPSRRAWPGPPVRRCALRCNARGAIGSRLAGLGRGRKIQDLTGAHDRLRHLGHRQARRIGPRGPAAEHHLEARRHRALDLHGLRGLAKAAIGALDAGSGRCSGLSVVRGRLRGLSWGNRPHFGADQPRRPQPRRPQPRRSMRWADVYVCMLADGVADENSPALIITPQLVYAPPINYMDVAFG